MRNTKEYQLAERIVHLQDAHIANKNLNKDGKLGVLSQNTNPSFRDANKFHKRVRTVLSEVV